ncbi:unnamed protein product [Spirodela intermedia]|uniref:Uncharacterized protein n=1 Tax=Spirodela intermedia TaxID=51605 RepID=A0A7I8IZD9_SPIIN|nr:unnamed protein product [Spirodela intermedia]CAA6663072.1 unnamed protein product [Spirodela intermedia]CAA6674152.1 unnamed protein product [Spirodela intermedia]CAA6674837.1 unnamed protein product [Spirodela intermedia]
MGASVCVFVESDREMKVIKWSSDRRHGGDLMKWITTVTTSKQSWRRENRLPNLGCDGRMKPIEINPNMKLLAIVLKGQEVDSKGLIDINLLDESLEVTVVGLKKGITLFAREKKLKD